MSYGQFLLLFLVPPLIGLLVISRRSLTKSVIVPLMVLMVVAVAYTGPWDSLLIRAGVWSYGRGRVLGLTVGNVPLEEYGFYVLQVAVTGLFVGLVARRWTRA